MAVRPVPPLTTDPCEIDWKQKRVHWTKPWWNYFDAMQRQIDTVAGDTTIVEAFEHINSTAIAENPALAAFLQPQKQFSAQGFAFPSLPAAIQNGLMPALLSLVMQQSWSRFRFIRDTEANQANYLAKDNQQSYYLATDSFKVYYPSAAGVWTQIIAPALVQFLGITSSFPALLRSGAKLQVVTADNGGFSDLEVLDEAYGAGWNASIEVPTKNAVYDQIEAVLALIAAFNPQVTTTVALTAQTATVGPTTMASSGTQWVFKYTLLITTTDVGVATVTVSVNYTDDIGATSQAAVAVAVTANNRQTGEFIIQRASGNVTYTVTVTGAIGTAVFAFHATLQRQAA